MLRRNAAIVTVLALCAGTMLISLPPAVAGHGNTKTKASGQHPAALAPVPRSPGVTRITSTAGIPHICAVETFADDDAFSSPPGFAGGTFEGPREIHVVGESWGTWNPQIDGIHVLWAIEGHVTIRFDSPVKAMLLKAEPNVFTTFPITVTAYDQRGRPLGSVSRDITGDSGAAFIGVRSQSRPIGYVRVTAPPAALGFAFSDLTWGYGDCR